MRVQLAQDYTSGAYNSFAPATFTDQAEPLQTDTDIQIYQDEHFPGSVTIKWFFVVIGNGNKIYSLEHATRYLVTETDDATMPADADLECMLKVSYDRFIDDIDSKTTQLPKFADPEKFSTMDVFELKQKIKLQLKNLAQESASAST